MKKRPSPYLLPLVALMWWGLAAQSAAQECPVSSFCTASPSQDATCRFAGATLPEFNTGDPAHRIDLVFLGDGYTQAELPKYRRDVELAVQHLFSESPLREYRAYFNVHRVDVVSPESGADRPAPLFNPPRCRSTVLDTEYDAACDRGTNTRSGAKIFNAAANAPAPADLFLVLVNDTVRGGCSGAVPFTSVVAMSDDVEGPKVLAHEFGHSFGGLADECVKRGQGMYRGEEPGFPNVTTITAPEFLKWKTWLDSTQPLPTRCPSSAVGLFEGAMGYERGVFRSMCKSKLSSEDAPWGVVNGEALIKEIYRFARPIEALSPQEFCAGVTSYCVDMAQRTEQRFAVTALQPSTGPLRVTWKLDGTVVQTGGASYLMRAGSVPGGDHTLVAAVEDLTPMVRNRGPGTFLSQEATWIVRTKLWGDVNDDGLVRIDELVSAVGCALDQQQDPELRRRVLDHTDRNADGRVSVDELIVAVNNALKGPDARQIDGNANGVIDSSELQALMSRASRPPALRLDVQTPVSFSTVPVQGLGYSVLMRGARRPIIVRAYLNGQPLLSPRPGTNRDFTRIVGTVPYARCRVGRNTLLIRVRDQLGRLAEASVVLIHR